MFVLDASLLVKLFRDENDSVLARSAIEHFAENATQMIAPTLVLYEVLSVALHYSVPFDVPMRLLNDLRQVGFLLLEPDFEELKQAERIATSRTPARGAPQLQDSIYHAMAIMRGGVFLTADERHFEKTKSLGCMTLLADWRPDQPVTPPHS
ncbi:type II toxin-antitoxin system VapC family toxin [Mesorhizobium xinjiangense]|uniref:type II toxin-antitoxin system VapC family toxin n=1 Tax=Mesorhizobium xinjiangense TaxID=2678685 RepID=UPI0012ED06E9|nr:type II toxin-antitoxin system VapC family toxin [Mesorhizobium xinjiangense]